MPPEVRIAGEQVTFAPDLGNDFEGAGPSSHPLDVVDPSIPDQTTGSAPAVRRFDRPGAYVYFCTVHGGADGSGMAGRVVVEAAAATTSTGTAPGTTTPATQDPAPVTPTPAAMPAGLTATVSVPRGVSATTLRRTALAVTVRTGRPAAGSARLRAGGVDLARARRTSSADAPLRLRLRLTAQGRRRVVADRSLRASLRLVARTASGERRTVTRAVRISGR